MNRVITGSHKGLSVNQREILFQLGKVVSWVEQHGTDYQKSILLNVWGIKWEPCKGMRNPSESAATSRSLKRLENRGLVIRKNDIRDKSRKTTRVLLTPEGRKVALAIYAKEIQAQNG